MSKKKEKLNYQLLMQCLSNIDIQAVDSTEVDIDEEILKLEALYKDDAYIKSKNTINSKIENIATLTLTDLANIIEKMFKSRYDEHGIGKYKGKEGYSTDEYFGMLLRRVPYKLPSWKVKNIDSILHSSEVNAKLIRQNNVNLDLVCMSKSKSTLRGRLIYFIQELISMGYNDAKLLHKEDVQTLIYSTIKENTYRDKLTSENTAQIFLSQYIKVEIDEKGNKLEETKTIPLKRFLVDYTNWLVQDPVKDYNTKGIVKGVKF
jgi:hypothetical protein